MKIYYVLTIFTYDTLFYCFDTLDLLLDFIKYRCDCDDMYYIERKWLSDDMIKILHIDYIKKEK